MARARFVWENTKRYYEEGNASGKSGLTKYVFVIEIGTIEPETLNFLAKLSPTLAFLSSESPTHRFLFYPESDEESLRINQLLSSLHEKDSRGFSWSIRRLSSRMVTPLETILIMRRLSLLT